MTNTISKMNGISGGALQEQELTFDVVFGQPPKRYVNTKDLNGSSKKKHYLKSVSACQPNHGARKCKKVPVLLTYNYRALNAEMDLRDSPADSNRHNNVLHGQRRHPNRGNDGPGVLRIAELLAVLILLK